MLVGTLAMMLEIAYTDETARYALHLIRAGQVPSSFAPMIGIDTGAVERWSHENGDFATKLAEAKKVGADVMVSECMTIADSQTGSPTDRKTRIETRLKLAGLWHPDKYGPKAEKDPGGISALVQMNYADLNLAQKAQVDKFFGTDDD